MGKNKRVSWQEKPEKEQEAKIVVITERMAGRFGDEVGQKMVIPRPRDVEMVVRQVPKGKLITPSLIRQRLASHCQVDVACPLTTGIFLWMVANAAFEDITTQRATQETVTPYWRVVKNDGSLYPKFPGGVEIQMILLQEEGYSIEEGKGKRPPRVRDFEKYLVER